MANLVLAKISAGGQVCAPVASNLNYGLNAVVANAVIVKVGVDGKVCLRNSGPAQIVVDVNGYLAT